MKGQRDRGANKEDEEEGESLKRELVCMHVLFCVFCFFDTGPVENVFSLLENSP